MCASTSPVPGPLLSFLTSRSMWVMLAVDAVLLVVLVIYWRRQPFPPRAKRLGVALAIISCLSLAGYIILVLGIADSWRGSVLAWERQQMTVLPPMCYTQLIERADNSTDASTNSFTVVGIALMLVSLGASMVAAFHGRHQRYEHALRLGAQR